MRVDFSNSRCGAKPAMRKYKERQLHGHLMSVGVPSKQVRRVCEAHKRKDNFGRAWETTVADIIEVSERLALLYSSPEDFKP